MKNAVSHVFEMIIGALLFVLGMWFLISNERVLNKLTDIVNDKVSESSDLYQQYNDLNLSIVSDEELTAIVMGFRDYPITIDGTVIEADGTDYEFYVTRIKHGLYTIKYEYDELHNINGVTYTYTGA